MTDAAALKVGDDRKPCCRPEAGNLRPHSEPGMPANVTAMKCSVCGCRHFEMEADPGLFKMRGRNA